MRYPLFILSLVAVAAPLHAQRRPLGIFFQWGAFAEKDAGRCFAIARPERAAKDGSASAAVGYWPRQAVRGQVSFRLSRPKRDGSAVLLRIDERVFQLSGRGADAWAPDARADADIVAAMRSGVEMRVETRAQNGAMLREHYKLRGAATAIDAAAIACADAA
jgi:hypothetical protein